MADISDSGAIQHIWMTLNGDPRLHIIRIYWDGEEHPSVECPVGDFFACDLGQPSTVTSSMVSVNPYMGLNCYWMMPFRKHCRITLTNLSDTRTLVFYQIDYTLTDVLDDMAYFHAQFRRVNPLPAKEVYTLVDGIQGHGTLCRNLPDLGPEEHRLVGSRRDEVLHRRVTMNSRLSAGRARRTTSGAPIASAPLAGTCTNPSAQRIPGCLRPARLRGNHDSVSTAGMLWTQFGSSTT